MTSVLTNKATRWLAALVASALVLALMVGGDQRSAQAIGPGETDIAYVADGYNFPDALMGATLAALNAAPMLGVRGPATGDVVPPDTADELDRLTNDKANKLATIYVFGGPAAVSDKVVGELEAWADNVDRIFGDDRFGTMEAISQMLPTKVKDSDLLDGKDSTDFLGASEKSADSDLLDGKDSTAFLGAAEKASDSDLLDGHDSSVFLGGTLPSNVTFKGVWQLGETTGANDRYWYAESWAGTVSGTLTVHYIDTDDPVPAGCSGSSTDPGADAGHLCVFEAVAGGTVTDVNVFSPEDGFSGDGDYPFGFGLFESQPTEGNFAYGSWAMTTP